jgi:hypothetical protein
MNLQEILKRAEESGSYLLTLSVKDKTKTENDLSHFLTRREFPTDDIVPSLDACVRSMGIKFEKPADVIIPPAIIEDKKPLRVAIISHFNSMPASYSPARAVKNQIKILKNHGHDVTIFLNERSHLTEEDLGCKILKIIPAFHREKMVVNEEIKNKLINIFKEQLTDNFDIAITHDLFLQDTISFSEAIRQCGVDIPWLHFARSGVAHNMTFAMPNAKFVYLNYSDVGRFAKAIKVPAEQCRTVFNEKEPAFMFRWHPVTKMIVDKYRLWERDIIMTIGLCSTRFDAKGVDSIIRVFVELKRLGNKVALILCNANGRRRVDDLKRKVEFAKELGLNEDEFIITSLLADGQYQIQSEVPNQVVAELMSVSNLFIMASIAEVGPNVWSEAAMCKNLLVANSDLPLLYDFVDKENVLSYPFSSRQNLHFNGGDNKSLNELAKQIVGELKSNKSDLTFRKVWRNQNAETIYNMLARVLYEDIK